MTSFGPLKLPLFISLLGLVFSWATLQGMTESICTSQGCTLYHDVTLLGFSLWVYGAAAFGICALLALLKKGSAGFLLCRLALFLDLFLLLLLSLTSPCANCLIVAFLLGANYLAFKAHSRPPKKEWLFSFWAFFFLVNIFSLLTQSLSSYAIYGEEEASLHLYFSPSCPQCQEGIRFYSGNLDAAFYPVLEKKDDLAKVIAMKKGLDKGLSPHEALTEALASPSEEISFFSHIPLRFRLLRNKAHVLLQGSQGVPYLESRGLPRVLQKEIQRRKKTEDMPSPAREPIELNDFSPRQCTESSCP